MCRDRARTPTPTDRHCTLRITDTVRPTASASVYVCLADHIPPHKWLSLHGDTPLCVTLSGPQGRCGRVRLC